MRNKDQNNKKNDEKCLHHHHQQQHHLATEAAEGLKYGSTTINNSTQGSTGGGRSVRL